MNAPIASMNPPRYVREMFDGHLTDSTLSLPGLDRRLAHATTAFAQQLSVQGMG